MRKVVILGAAGRDFHNFNVCFRSREDFRIVAFTAAQIPGIDGRRYPPELAGALYPEGIPIVLEQDLEHLIREESVDTVVFSYSDVSYSHVMHTASRAMAAGADFWLLSAKRTQLVSSVPVISVCAVRTGCGKSQTSRRVVDLLKSLGRKVVVVRHPMPYGDLARQVVQRFAAVEDLDRHRCTIEEREEYEPHVSRGVVVYAGVDYERILERAAAEADVILWDGGNNDASFFRSDLEIVVADPHRAGCELNYFPSEENLRRAHAVVINKVNTAAPEKVAEVRENIRRLNSDATVIEADSEIRVGSAEQIHGKRVLVIEDGPTLTHGEMSYGAGVVAARGNGASELVDPRPYAVGSIREVFRSFPHLGNLLPAMGYGEGQRRELQETINAVPCDLVLVATPIDLGRIIRIDRPCQRVTYELKERTEPGLRELLFRVFRDEIPA